MPVYVVVYEKLVLTSGVVCCLSIVLVLLISKYHCARLYTLEAHSHPVGTGGDLVWVQSEYLAGNLAIVGDSQFDVVSHVCENLVNTVSNIGCLC